MPDIAPDRLFVLADAQCIAIVDARTKMRSAAIDANVAARKAARATAAGKPVDAGKADGEKATALATATAEQAKLDAQVAAVKVAHAADKLAPTDEGYEPVQGAWVMKFDARLAGNPPVVKRRIPMSDADADAYATSYKASCVAGDEARELERQRVAYLDAHPGLAAGAVPGGEPPPVDKDYEALKVARDAKADLAMSEEAKQGALVAPYLKDEAFTYCRIDIPTGDVVLGDVVAATEKPKDVN